MLQTQTGDDGGLQHIVSVGVATVIGFWTYFEGTFAKSVRKASEESWVTLRF